MASSTSTSAGAAFPACGCGLLQYECPSIDNTQYTSKGSSGKKAVYKYLCNEDYGGLVKPKGNGVNDISITNATTVEECADACTSWNVPNTSPCLGISFHANLSFIIGTQGEYGNCFLKKDVSNPTPMKATHYGMSAYVLP